MRWCHLAALNPLPKNLCEETSSYRTTSVDSVGSAHTVQCALLSERLILKYRMYTVHCPAHRHELSPGPACDERQQHQEGHHRDILWGKERRGSAIEVFFSQRKEGEKRKEDTRLCAKDAKELRRKGTTAIYPVGTGNMRKMQECCAR